MTDEPRPWRKVTLWAAMTDGMRPWQKACVWLAMTGLVLQVVVLAARLVVALN